MSALRQVLQRQHPPRREARIEAEHRHQRQKQHRSVDGHRQSRSRHHPHRPQVDLPPAPMRLAALRRHQRHRSHQKRCSPRRYMYSKKNLHPQRIMYQHHSPPCCVRSNRSNSVNVSLHHFTIAALLCRPKFSVISQYGSCGSLASFTFNFFAIAPYIFNAASCLSRTADTCSRLTLGRTCAPKNTFTSNSLLGTSSATRSFNHCCRWARPSGVSEYTCRSSFPFRRSVFSSTHPPSPCLLRPPY